MKGCGNEAISFRDNTRRMGFTSQEEKRHR